MKKVSIITINLNNKDGLRKTAESVVSQTAFSGIEWIVIDGGSTDGSVDVINQFSDKIAYWISEPDKGIYNAMNKGVVQAQGEYVIFLNSGDVFAGRGVISRFVSSDKFGEFDHVVGSANLVKDSKALFCKSPLSESSLSGLLLLKNPIVHQAQFIRRTRFSNTRYDERYCICADMKFSFDDIILCGATYAVLDVVVVNYDCSGISSRFVGQRMQEEEQYLKEVLPKRVYTDYVKWQKGDCLLTRIVIKLEKYPLTRFFLTVCSCFLYFPIYLKNLMTYRLKKRLNNGTSDK